jgi:hypothetical protein
MSIFGSQNNLTTTRAAVIEPPIGFVDLEFDDDEVSMIFDDDSFDRLPNRAVRAFARSGQDVTLSWGGTPIVLSFESSAASAQAFDRLGGFDDSARTFTFMLESNVA